MEAGPPMIDDARPSVLSAKRGERREAIRALAAECRRREALREHAREKSIPPFWQQNLRWRLENDPHWRALINQLREQDRRNRASDQEVRL